MQTNKDSAHCTNLSPSQINKLLEFIERSTYFMHNGNSHEKKEGAAMGDQVSAVIANI